MLSLTLIACEPQHSTQTAPADVAPSQGVRLVHNARIYTMDGARSQATALAWDGSGAILAVGDSADLLAAYPQAELQDLQGRTVLPGLIDAHGHLHGLAVALSQANLTGTTNKEEVLARLRTHAQGLAPQDWLLGRGWDQNDWPEQVFPGRRELDELFPDRPVWLRRIDGHAGWANSAALALADRDLTGDWQPAGGFIHRDQAGNPTGVLIDGAMGLIDPLVPEPSEQLLVESLDLAIAQMVRWGLTGVHDPGVDVAVVERYIRRIEAGRFATRVYAMTDGAGATLDWLCERGMLDHPSGRLLMRSAKLYQDGALGSRGAALLADYADEPGNRGLLFFEPKALRSQVRKVLDCGFQVGIHAIGDQANQSVLDVLGDVAAEFPDNPGRHRIEHVQILAPADVRRFAELSVIAAMQPTHATSDMYWAGRRLGEERLRYSYAWRSLLDSGARLALGSDFPVEQVNPMLGIYAAVTRRDLEGWPPQGWQAQERLTRHEALRGFTLDAAYAAFMEHRVGSLEAGKRADFVVLDRDIMRIEDAEIPRVGVLETWLDGERVYPPD